MRKLFSLKTRNYSNSHNPIIFYFNIFAWSKYRIRVTLIASFTHIDYMINETIEFLPCFHSFHLLLFCLLTIKTFMPQASKTLFIPQHVIWKLPVLKLFFILFLLFLPLNRAKTCNSQSKTLKILVQIEMFTWSTLNRVDLDGNLKSTNRTPYVSSYCIYLS